MAKLSAHGYELVRYEREGEPKNGYQGGPVWHRLTYSIRSDGAVMKKEDCRWADGMTHVYGWNLVAGPRSGKKTTPEQLTDFQDRLMMRGYRQTFPAPCGHERCL